MRVFLRRVVAADVPMILRLHEDGPTAALLFPRTVRSSQEVMEWLASANTPPHSVAFSVVLGEKPIGLAWFYGMDSYQASLGFGLEEGARGDGLAAEAAVVGIDMAFKRMGLRRLTGGAVESNLPCLKLMRRLGFVEEGRMRNATFHDGVWRDNVLFGLLAEEWKGSECLQR